VAVAVAVRMNTTLDTSLLTSRVHVTKNEAVSFNESEAEGVAESRPLISPGTNDTLSQTSWNEIEAGLSSAAKSTTVMHTDTSPDQVQESNTSRSWRYKSVGDLNQPYITKLGAAILYSADEHPSTEKPDQDVVSQEYVAQCPMLLFDNSITVRPPRCGETMGTWTTEKNQTLARWWRGHGGTLHFKVDSRGLGPGSVDFARLEPQASFTTATYRLLNCLGANGFFIEEQVSMLSSSHPYMQYYIKWPNNTDAAASSFFRLNANTFNVTHAKESGIPESLGTVKRVGNWIGDQWTRCSTTSAEWQISYMAAGDGNQATVQDKRIAMATMVTLMASRDEGRSQDTGLTENGGETNALIFYALTWFIIVGVMLIFGAICMAFQDSWFAIQARRWLKRFESSLLPPRRFVSRQAPMYAAW